MTVRHVVIWKLAAEDLAQKAQDAAGIVERMSALDGVVPMIRSLSVGVDVVSGGAYGDVALIADFDDTEALEAYQVHPAHREATHYVRELVSSRHAVDFEV